MVFGLGFRFRFSVVGSGIRVQGFSLGFGSPSLSSVGKRCHRLGPIAVSEGDSSSLTVQQLQRDRRVHVLPPVLPVRGHGNLPVGPLARQVDAHTRNHCGLVLKAECGEVEAACACPKRGGECVECVCFRERGEWHAGVPRMMREREN